MKRGVENPADHACKYCSAKKQKLQSASHLQFRPPTLRQLSLLQTAYATYAKTGDQSVEYLPVPTHLIEELKTIHEEMDRWDQDTATLYKMMGKRYNFRHRDFDHDYDSSLEWDGHRCFLTDLHWVPEKNVIDRRATANMILQCDLGFDRRNEFLLAAANCLEMEVTRLWPLLHMEIRERWPSSYYCVYTQHPVFTYWIGKVTNNPGKTNRALQSMTMHCLHGGEHNFTTLKYFWPMIVESMGGIDSNKMKDLFDHAFHESIQRGNRAATFFIWSQAPKENYRSMVSAERCCGARNYYYSFQKAVERGQCDVVRLLWDNMDDQQHNRVLLAEHAKAFCKAAEQGYADIARLLWQEATFNQKFILLFEQTCLAFRLACANGRLGVVRLLWEDASVDQRRQMLTVCECAALTSPCKNSHLEVVRYLWENMGEELQILMDTLMENSMMLSKCICESAVLVAADASSKNGSDGAAILRYIFSASNDIAALSNPTPFRSQLVHALLFSDAAALKALLKRGELTGKWDEIADLLKGIQPQERPLLCAKMSADQAYLCGFSPSLVDVARVEAMPSSIQNGLSTACVPKKPRCE